MTDNAELFDRLRARPVDGVVNLAGYDPGETPLVDGKSEAKAELADMQDELFDAHELLFAEKKHSVLLVLQGLDTSGKNGTIKHVVIAMNPAGVRTASFTEPTEEEKDHHFLWRHKKELPAPGELGVFDRSHYEDALVPLAHGNLDDDALTERLGEINDFEQGLIDNGTVVLKCLLHISFDEQRERFLRRLRRDDKRWKFSPADLEARRMWNEYQAAYGTTVGRTSPDSAPWYVIPADHKWYRNWVIARLLLATFESIGSAYPQPDYDLAALRTELEPPN